MTRDRFVFSVWTITAAFEVGIATKDPAAAVGVFFALLAVWEATRRA